MKNGFAPLYLGLFVPWCRYFRIGFWWHYCDTRRRGTTQWGALPKLFQGNAGLSSPLCILILSSNVCVYPRKFTRGLA